MIPRPDTETLVEETLKLFNVNSKLNMLDIGTGSGCILISILKERINFTLHKLKEFMEGEIFDEMIENLNLQAQEEKLNNLN